MDYRDFQKLPPNNEEHFWYRARRLLVSQLLKRTLKIYQPQRRIIEIGCGTGIQLPLLARYGAVEGLDISPEGVGEAQKAGFSARVFNIESDPLEDNSVDVIACFDVLEHLQNDTLALRKITDTLSPEGIFLFSVPSTPWLFGPHDRAASHYRRYSQKEIRQKIAQSGLKLQEISYWNSWMFPAIAVMRLLKKIVSPKEQAESDTKPLPRILNQILYGLLALETKTNNRGIRLPWGLSLYGWAVKK